MTPDQESLSPLAPATGAHHAPDTEMGRLVAGHDWSATPLGPIDSWPETLATAVSICLSSRFPMLICWGPDLRMIYNDAYLELLGEAKHADALGQPVARVWPEIWDVIAPMFAGVMAGGPATWSEDQRLDVDRRGFAEEAFFTWTYGPIQGPDGAVEGVLNVAVETTDKVLAVRRAGVTAALVADLARAEDVAEVRAAVSNTMGADPADHLSVDLLLVDEARVEHHDAGTEGLDGLGGPDGTDGSVTGGRALHRIAVREPGRDDLAGYLVVEPNPMRPWDESLQRHVVTCAAHVATALAGLDRLELERGRARALADLDAARSVFFANMSHELRTPLTLVSGPAHDALEDVQTPLPDVHRERLALIERNSLRLLSLVDRLLDLTRLEAGAVRPHPSDTDVTAVTQGLSEAFRPAIARAGLQLSESITPLPSPACLDPEMFERIVLNLLSNAVKFTTEGSISIRLQPSEDGFEVSVSDTGVGIAPADVQRIFERFQQVAPATGSSRGGGAGIGLSLTRELVELMGGRISVESEVGVGSTFRVELPLKMPPPPLDTPTGQSISKRSVESFLDEVTLLTAGADTSVDLGLPASGTAGPLKPGPVPGPRASGVAAASAKPRLLLVEDHLELRQYLAKALASDYEVTTAADGLQGLALARTRRPDVILADVMMPRLDGNGLVRELRAQPATADVPVVLLSAHAAADARVSGLEGGADDYLVKPFDLGELRARLVAVLRRPAQREQEARERRDRATAFASELGAAVDLEQVVVAAVAGFSVLFDGTATVRVTGGEADLLFTPDGVADPATLPSGIRDVLSLGTPGGPRRTDPRSDVADQARAGLLLSPSSAASTCRVWVQFRAVRPVSVDEEIVGDLLARSFAQAVDQVMDREDRETKERQLQQAIESHRFIGQAVGVLIERHKVTAVQGFEMLRQASLQRNIKLREIATRVVESGEEPMQA